MLAPFKTAARNVRTGQVIKQASDNYSLGLEVEIVHHVRYGRETRVAVTGWTNNWDRVEQAWTCHPDREVLVVEDRQGGNTFGNVA